LLWPKNGVQQEEKANEREGLYLVSEFARDYFQQVLSNSEEGKALGLTYFKERGFTDETIATFQLGYSLDSWSALTDEAIAKGMNVAYLEKT